jgi:hypothetical protein
VEIVDEMMTSSSRKSSAAKAEKKRGSALSLHTFQASGGLAHGPNICKDTKS